LRIALGLSEEEFSKLSKEQIRRALPDQGLFQFLYVRRGYNKTELEFIIKRIEDTDFRAISPHVIEGVEEL
jgi:hypothetical protein